MIELLIITLAIFIILSLLPHHTKEGRGTGRVTRQIAMITFAVIAILFFVFGAPQMPSTLGILSVAVNITFNIALLTFLFNKLSGLFKATWLRYFYYIGVSFIIVTSLGVSSDMNYYSIDQIISEVAIVAVLVAVCSAGIGAMAYFISLITKLRDRGLNGETFPQYIPKNKDIMQHYYEQDLTDSEIAYFREQMATAKEQILTIETELNQTAKLRAIEVRFNTVQVMQSFFKDIVEEPKRVNQASQFIYKFLPSLEDLAQKYNEINSHVAKNKQTYLILEKSAQTIENLCEQITDEYVTFHQSTYQEMQDEIKLANRNLSSKEARKQFSQEPANSEMFDSVDDILKESNDWLTDNHDDSTSQF